ncbi:MAG: hypothetical protein AAB737_02585, partial [Patescibacteria group bacterium]
MKGLINFIAWLVRAGTQIYARKWSFLGLFCVMFFAMVFILARLDLLPEMVQATRASQVTLSASSHSATNTRTLPPLRVELP